MPESSEDDPVAECVRQLQNNDESLIHLCLARIIPEVYEDGELDEHGEEVDYEGKDVNDKAIRIADALANNTVVQSLDFGGMRDKVSRTGALSIGQALAINRSVTTVTLYEEPLQNPEHIALILQHISKNPHSAVTKLVISTYDEGRGDFSHSVTNTLSELLLSRGIHIKQLFLEGLRIDDGGGILLSEGLLACQQHIERVEIEKGDYGESFVSPWAALAICNVVPKDTKLKFRIRQPINNFECTAIRKLFLAGKRIESLAIERDYTVDEWRMSDEALEILAEAFRVNRSVKSLALRLQASSSLLIERLIFAIFAPGIVSDLSLHCGSIGPRGAKAIGDSLRNDTSLTCLKLFDCNIGDAGAEFLSDGMRNNTSLKQLAISRDKVGYRGMWNLSLAISETQIEVLEIQMLDRSSAGAEAEIESDRQRLETGTLSRLLACNSPLKQLSISCDYPGSMPPISLSSFKEILNALTTNSRILGIRLPLDTGHIIRMKDEISDLLQNNCHLKSFCLQSNIYDKFSDEQRPELKAMMMNALQQNHTVTSVWGLLDCGDDADIRRMLYMNRNGVIAAAASKGAPLPNTYVENLPDVAIPNALAKIGSKAGVIGVYSFLKQIYAATIISSHSAVSVGKKRTRQ